MKEKIVRLEYQIKKPYIFKNKLISFNQLLTSPQIWIKLWNQMLKISNLNNKILNKNKYNEFVCKNAGKYRKDKQAFFNQFVSDINKIGFKQMRISPTQRKYLKVFEQKNICPFYNNKKIDLSSGLKWYEIYIKAYLLILKRKKNVAPLNYILNTILISSIIHKKQFVNLNYFNSS